MVLAGSHHMASTGTSKTTTRIMTTITGMVSIRKCTIKATYNVHTALALSTIMRRCGLQKCGRNSNKILKFTSTKYNILAFGDHFWRVYPAVNSFWTLVARTIGVPQGFLTFLVSRLPYVLFTLLKIRYLIQCIWPAEVEEEGVIRRLQQRKYGPAPTWMGGGNNQNRL